MRGRCILVDPLRCHSMEQPADSKHGSRSLRRVARSRSCSLVDGTRIHQRGHDDRDYPDHGIALALLELRGIFSPELLHPDGPRAKCLSIPQGFQVNRL